MAIVRPANSQDAERLSDLSSQLGYPASTQELNRRLLELKGLSDHSVMVAEVEDSVRGWIHVFAAHRLESLPFAEIGGLVVDAEFVGKGLGKVLVEAAEAWARGRELASIRVRSNVARKEAHAFYRHLGYAVAKTQGVFTRDLTA